MTRRGKWRKEPKPTIPKGQLAYFRIYPEPPKRRYFTVRVFKNLASMHTFGRKMRGIHLGSDYAGLTTNWLKAWVTPTEMRMSPHCGEMLLANTHLNAEVISHECAHLAIGFARRAKFAVDFAPIQKFTATLADPLEERFCYVLGRLTQQVVDGIYRRKLGVGGPVTRNGGGRG